MKRSGKFLCRLNQSKIRSGASVSLPVGLNVMEHDYGENVQSIRAYQSPKAFREPFLAASIIPSPRMNHSNFKESIVEPPGSTTGELQRAATCRRRHIALQPISHLFATVFV